MKRVPRILALLLAAVLILGQLVVTFIISRRLRRQSIIDRIRGTE